MTWEEISKNLTEGEIFTSRTGKEYRVDSIDPKGYRIARTDTGSIVRISAKKVLEAHQRLVAGDLIKFQATPANGGISYTVAVTVGAMYPLRRSPGYIVDNAQKSYRRKA
jgi:hypothetical protein